MIVNEKDLYKLTATISTEGEEEIILSFLSDTLESVKANFFNCIENEKKCFGFTNGEEFVDYTIEQNDVYIDSDSCVLVITDGKIALKEAV